MIVRIWKVSINPGKGAELEAFANKYSLPMFREQPGCLSVLFSRTEEQCVTLTVWNSEQSVKELETRDHYKSVVRDIEESGIIGQDHHTEVFSIYGGFVSDEIVRHLT